MFKRTTLSVQFLVLALPLFCGRVQAACDPNESCNRCLVSAFGHCIQHGNDIVCEARKKACRANGSLVSVPGLTPFSPNAPLASGGPIGISLSDCTNDIAHCSTNLISQFGWLAIGPILQPYIDYLEGQAKNKWQTLPPAMISDLAPDYAIDLTQIRYAFNIDTIHKKDITIGNDIFFVDAPDFNDPSEVQVLYHELQHAVQYKEHHGVNQFLVDYVLHGGGQMIAHKSFNIHDDINLENEAIAKASQMAAARNGDDIEIDDDCSKPILVAVSFEDPTNDDERLTAGWWEVAPQQTTKLSYDGRIISSRRRLFEVAAHSDDGTLVWGSNSILREVQGENHETAFFGIDDSESTGEMVSKLSCPGN
jgi:hypothetical protein